MWAKAIQVTIEEIREFFNEHKDDEAAKQFLVEITPKITPELIMAFLDGDEGSKILATHPATDQRVTQAVKTATEKERVKIDAEVKRLVAAEVLKRNPTESDEQRQIRELKESFESEKSARARETLQRQLIEEGSKKKVDAISLIEAGWMPASLEEGLVTLEKVAKRDADLEARIRSEMVASGSYKPGSGQGTKDKVDIKSLTRDQMIALEKEGKLDAILTA